MCKEHGAVCVAEKGDTDPRVPVRQVIEHHLSGFFCSKITQSVSRQTVEEEDTGFGGEVRPVTTTSYGGLTKKNAPGYWDSGQTWIGNIEAMEAFIEENGGQYALSEMVRATEENADGLKLWSVADTVTAATNSDFKDYFDLVQSALGRLKTN